MVLWFVFVFGAVENVLGMFDFPIVFRCFILLYLDLEGLG